MFSFLKIIKIDLHIWRSKYKDKSQQNNTLVSCIFRAFLLTKYKCSTILKLSYFTSEMKSPAMQAQRVLRNYSYLDLFCLDRFQVSHRVGVFKIQNNNHDKLN